MGMDLQKRLALMAGAGLVAGLVGCGGAPAMPEAPTDDVPDADAPESAVFANDPVTRHHNRNRIIAIGSANRTNRFWFSDGFCNLAIAFCMTGWNFPELQPDFFGKFGPLQYDWYIIKCVERACKILC